MAMDEAILKAGEENTFFFLDTKEIHNPGFFLQKANIELGSCPV